MVTKSLLFSFAIVGLLTACKGQKPKSEPHQTSKTENPAPPMMVGGDSDEHGCKASAGYTWSSIKNECVRLFEVGIRLDPKAEGLDKALSAFAVFKSDTDDAQVEIFLPADKKTYMLKKVGKENAGTWKNDKYVLTQWKGMYSLETTQKKLLYQGAAVK